MYAVCGVDGRSVNLDINKTRRERESTDGLKIVYSAAKAERVLWMYRQRMDKVFPLIELTLFG